MENYTPLNLSNNNNGYRILEAGRKLLFAAKASSPKVLSKITLPLNKGRLVVDINEVIRCQSDNNYTWFFFSDGRKEFVSRTLKEYDRLLQNNGFYRVHQSHLINIKYIKQYVKGEKACFIMADGSSVPVSQRKKGLANKIIKQL